MKKEQNLIDLQNYLNWRIEIFLKDKREEEDPLYKLVIQFKIDLINDILDEIEEIKIINAKKEEVQKALEEQVTNY